MSSADARPPPRRFGRAFWVLNTIEMGERLAFYNLRVMAPIYIMQADNPGGLHLSAAEKGTIYAWWAVFHARGPQIPQQVLLSANAFFIILGVVPAAWLTRRMRTLEAMLIGVLTATAGVLVAGLTTSALVVVAGIVFFSIGEMTTGPKNNEYLGLIAPAGKKGLYLDYVNIPVGVGVYAGSKIAGYVYGHYGEKAVLALRYLAERTPFGQGKGWDGDVTRLEGVLGVPRTQAMAKLVEVTGWTRPPPPARSGRRTRPSSTCGSRSPAWGWPRRWPCGSSGAWPAAGAT